MLFMIQSCPTPPRFNFYLFSLLMADHVFDYYCELKRVKKRVRIELKLNTPDSHLTQLPYISRICHHIEV